MIDLTDLTKKAEGELLASEALMRTTKAGILFGVLAATLQKYRELPVQNEDVLKLMEILVRDGRLLETLPMSQTMAAITDTPQAVRDDAVPQPSLSPEEQSARDEDIRIMRARGFREEEIQAILALGGLDVSGEVEGRSDEQIARHEEEKHNQFPGVPHGTQINNSFTITPPEELPDDLKAATS